VKVRSVAVVLVENEDVTERSVRGQVKVRSVAVVLVAGQ